MKSEKGITLISLIVYIIVMTIVVALVASISTFFYKNVKNVNQTVEPITEYTKLNSFLSEEINNRDIRIIEVDETNNYYIIFENNGSIIQYEFIPENKGIYRNNVKICRGIENCTFTNSIENGKNVIDIYLKAGNEEKTTTYTLNN